MGKATGRGAEMLRAIFSADDARYDGVVRTGPTDDSLPEGITLEMADAGTLAFIDAVAAEASAKCAAIKIYRAMAEAAPRPNPEVCGSR